MKDDTISRQAAIDALRYAQHRFTVADEAGGMGTVKWSEDVIYFAAAERALTDLPSAQPEPQWIPCSERLPEDDVEVLVTDDAGGVQWLGVDKMLSYEDGSGRFWLVSQNPSAWMPLPAPYRSEGEKK